MNYQKLDAVKIGNKLKALRTEKALTMDEEAKALGISTSAVGMYENGERIPRDEIKIRFAEFFMVTVESIFFQNEQHEACC